MLDEVNKNSQVLSMETKLNALHGFYFREISVTDGFTNGIVRVVLSRGEESPLNEAIERSVTKFFNKVKIAGKKLEIINT